MDLNYIETRLVLFLFTHLILMDYDGPNGFQFASKTWFLGFVGSYLLDSDFTFLLLLGFKANERWADEAELG